MDLQHYVKSNAPAIFEAGRFAYHNAGKGALCVFPQQDNGKGKAGVAFIPEEQLRLDNDPILQLVEKYNPECEAFLIIGLEQPPRIYTYRVRLLPVLGPVNIYGIEVVHIDW